jgi:hypothetical protein
MNILTPQLLNRTTVSNWLLGLGCLFFCASCGFAPKPVAIYENEFFALDSITRYPDENRNFFECESIFWKENQSANTNPIHRIYWRIKRLDNIPYTKIPQKHKERLVLLTDSTYLYGESWGEIYWIAKGEWSLKDNKTNIHFSFAKEYLSTQSPYFSDFPFIQREPPTNDDLHLCPHIQMPQHLANSLNISNIRHFGKKDLCGGVYTFDLPTSTKEIQFIHPARNLQRTFSVWE